MYKFLIIDDSIEILELLAEELRMKYSQCYIKKATSGLSAIDILKQEKDFHFIISDYEMPNGSGSEVVKYMEEQKTTIPFLFYTSHIAPQIPATIYTKIVGTVEKTQLNLLFDRIKDVLDTRI